MTRNRLTKKDAVAMIADALQGKIPDHRDQTIYYQVVIEGRPEAEVAARFGLTKDDLQLVMVHMSHWVEQIQLPIVTHNLFSKHLERLEQQWYMVMTAWHRSCEVEETTKTTVERKPVKEPAEKAAPVSAKANGKCNASAQANAHARAKASEKPEYEDEKQKVERTARKACGDVRYLEQARKIMVEIRHVTEQAMECEQSEEPKNVEDLTFAERVAETVKRIAQIRSRAEGADEGQ